MPTGPCLFMSFAPAGPVFYTYGPSPNCLVSCAILTVLSHDMLSLLSLNIARHLDSYPNSFSLDNDDFNNVTTMTTKMAMTTTTKTKKMMTKILTIISYVDVDCLDDVDDVTDVSDDDDGDDDDDDDYQYD